MGAAASIPGERKLEIEERVLELASTYSAVENDADASQLYEDLGWLHAAYHGEATPCATPADDQEALARIHELIDQLLDAAAPAPLASPRDALGSFELPGGASLREITYLSEQLWISRSGDDGSVVVLGRSEATPLMPPAGRADLTATCAEAVFVRGAVCRRQSLLDAK